jgi:transcriptional regulator with PAS, ATPase and Fis domain
VKYQSYQIVADITAVRQHPADQPFYHLLLEEAIRLSGGNKSKAAKLLNVSRKNFYRMLEKYK